MKKLTFLLPIILFMVVGCKEKPVEDMVSDDALYIKGSDTQHKMVEDLAKTYSSRTGVEYDVQGGGSTKGAEAIINGTANIANCSRPMYFTEFEEAEANGKSLVPVIIAIDAVALITNPKNKVDSLSTIELRAILSGEIDNWKELGGDDRTINFYGRDESSGTYSFLENRFVRYEGFSSEMNEMEDNQSILEAVIKDTFAFGYVGAGFLMDEKGRPNPDIWAMYLYTEGDDEAYSPYEITEVIEGNYPLIRPLFQYFDGTPEGKLKDFLQFELSDEGQDIIRQHGFFPITSKYESENEANGITF